MHQTENDLVFSVIVACISLGVIALFFVAVIINYYRVNARRQNEIFNAMFETQMRERQRISEDLHDELGPFLAGIKMRVGVLKEVSELSAQQELIKETESSLNTAIQDIRRISKNLMPKNLEEHGLIVELEELKNLIEKTKPVKMNLSFLGLDKRMPPMFELNVFRILNELVNNTLKHSEANYINIIVSNSKDGFRVIFHDNGKGFASNTKSDGIGLKNIESRINLFKGKYIIDSREHEGTTFKIIFQNNRLY
jgi:two-component system, NarL family, sensor kinase